MSDQSDFNDKVLKSQYSKEPSFFYFNSLKESNVKLEDLLLPDLDINLPNDKYLLLLSFLRIFVH